MGRHIPHHHSKDDGEAGIEAWRIMLISTAYRIRRHGKDHSTNYLLEVNALHDIK